MILIVKNETDRIINDYLLVAGDYECISLLDSWKDVNGEVCIPTDSRQIELPDDLYDFKADENDDGYTNTYYYVDGQITLKRIVEPEYVRQQITDLQNKLNCSDYKIIKSYEYRLIGSNAEYNVEELHTERQLIRDKINELETLLKPI